MRVPSVFAKMPLGFSPTGMRSASGVIDVYNGDMIRTTHGDIGIMAHHAFVCESNLLWIGAYLKGCNFGLSGGVDHINVIAPGIGFPDTPIRAQRQKVRVDPTGMVLIT